MWRIRAALLLGPGVCASFSHFAKVVFFVLAGVEHLDLTNCQLQRFPAGAVLSAPLLRTLHLAGNCDMVLTEDDIDTLEAVSFLQVLVSWFMLVGVLIRWGCAEQGSGAQAAGVQQCTAVLGCSGPGSSEFCPTATALARCCVAEQECALPSLINPCRTCGVCRSTQQKQPRCPAPCRVCG